MRACLRRRRQHPPLEGERRTAGPGWGDSDAGRDRRRRWFSPHKPARGGGRTGRRVSPPPAALRRPPQGGGGVRRNGSATLTRRWRNLPSRRDPAPASARGRSIGRDARECVRLLARRLISGLRGWRGGRGRCGRRGDAQAVRSAVVGFALGEHGALRICQPRPAKPLLAPKPTRPWRRGQGQASLPNGAR